MRRNPGAGYRILEEGDEHTYSRHYSSLSKINLDGTHSAKCGDLALAIGRAAATAKAVAARPAKTEIARECMA